MCEYISFEDSAIVPDDRVAARPAVFGQASGGGEFGHAARAPQRDARVIGQTRIRCVDCGLDHRRRWARRPAPRATISATTSGSDSPNTAAQAIANSVCSSLSIHSGLTLRPNAVMKPFLRRPRTLQVAVGVERAEIARCDPHFGAAGFAEVTEHRRAADVNFAVDDLDADVAQRASDGAGPIGVRQVQRDDRAAFGEPVAFEHRNADALRAFDQ